MHCVVSNLVASEISCLNLVLSLYAQQCVLSERKNRGFFGSEVQKYEDCHGTHHRYLYSNIYIYATHQH